MYLDSAYLAKYYVNERDSDRVRQAIRDAESHYSSIWAIGEISCVFHRHVRDGVLRDAQARELFDAFLEHVHGGLWELAPITAHLLERVSLRVSNLPAGVFLRAGDAVHLTTASELKEPEIWTNDRHLLAAAPHFGLSGRTA